MSRFMRSLLVFACLVTAVAILGATLPVVPTGQWVGSSNLQQARSGAAAVVLPDGRTLITGGDVSGAPSASVEVFNSDGSLSSAAPMSAARSGHSAVVLPGGGVLVTGGRTGGGGITNSAEIYDPVNDVWSAAPAMNSARAGHTSMTLADSSVLIVGGVNSGGAVSEVERYSPTDNAFIHAGALTTARADAAAALLPNGNVMVAGGSVVAADGTSSPTTSVEIFDPSAGSSSSGAALNSARAGATATTVLDGRVVVIGGNDGSNDLASAEVYDPVAGAWSTVAGGAPRSHHLAVLLPNNNAVLVTGGTGATATDLFVPWANSNAGAFQSIAPSLVSHANGVAVPLSAEGLLFAATGDSGAATELYRFATVKTDANDYAPGTTVTITGSGWQPGETVTLTLVESPLIDTHPALTAVADAGGNIFNDQFSPDSHDINVRFYLTASGSSSGLSAQTSFTDAAAATVTFATDSPCAVTGTVTFTNNGGHLVSGQAFTTSTASATVGTSPATSVSYTYESSVVCSGTTYNFISASPASPFNSGAAGSATTVTAHYVLATVPTTTAVASSANPSVFGQSVTFTADVHAASGSSAPTGTVQFVIDGVNFGAAVALGACSPPSSTDACASISDSTLSVGSHTVTANYLHTGSFNDSNGALAGGQTVNKADTSSTVASSVNPSVFGQSVTFTATVVAIAPGSGTPTGTVQFMDGATLLGSAQTLNGSGQATLSTSSLSVASHSIKAVYSGDGNFNATGADAGSTAPPLTQQVQYNVCLLYDPTRSVKSGATYPIKLYLCDVSGNDVSSSTIVLHATSVTGISSFSGSPEDAGNANPDSDFRYDSTLGPSGGYIFNLKTSGLNSGTYNLNFTAGTDPISHAAPFGVK